MPIEFSGAVAVQAPIERALERSPKEVSSAPISAAPAPPADRTTLSGTASVASLVGQALATPAVRQDKIDALRQSIASGNYTIDANKIADAITREGH